MKDDHLALLDRQPQEAALKLIAVVDLWLVYN